MKKIKFGFIIVLALTLTACKSHDDDISEQEFEDMMSEILDEEVVDYDYCDDLTLDDFDSFLGLDFNTAETEIVDAMGSPSDRDFTEDKTRLKYFYKDTKRVPVTVYVNAESGEIETIFMEILGLDDAFFQDVMKAEEDFNIDACHLDLFGMQPKEVTSIFGQADKDNIEEDSVEEGVRHLVYYTDDDKIAISFKFYHSQNNMMSSLTVDWFH